MEHRHAIFIIKNKEGKYLQYLDEKWDSYLFLNCKVKDETDFEAIYDKIEKSLNIKREDVKVRYVTDKIHTKFSYSDKVEKEYHHYFYIIDIDNIKISDGFKWYNMKELQEDKRAIKTNSDIIGFVSEIENKEM